MPKRLALVFVLIVVVLNPPSLWAQQCPRSESGDLLAMKLAEIKAAIPRRYEMTQRNSFVVPTADEQSAWSALTTAMIQNDLSSACSIIAANGFPYGVIQYTDVVTGNTYNILQEDIPPIGPIAKGWGTYIVKPSAATLVSVEIAHPLFDSNTPEQGVDAFRQLDAKTLLMAGTHRYANNTQSTCQPDPTVLGNNADVAHNVETMFEPAHEVIATQLPGTVFVQLHGNGERTCMGVAAFVSNGTTAPGPLVNQIVDLINLTPFYAEAATDQSACILKGTKNIQGRFSNGSSNLCNDNADAASETFIHIEQWDMSPPRLLRDPANRQVLIDALRQALLP